jgi:hypothetical protein
MVTLKIDCCADCARDGMLRCEKMRRIAKGLLCTVEDYRRDIINMLWAQAECLRNTTARSGVQDGS